MDWLKHNWKLKLLALGLAILLWVFIQFSPNSSVTVHTPPLPPVPFGQTPGNAPQ